ncbi:hypothetical protein C8J56DRAFT_884470 [Mycena floridula]|nr:hypothetical protein C8J56DRAFT_884470 [Mycena floridula]
MSDKAAFPCSIMGITGIVTVTCPLDSNGDDDVAHFQGCVRNGKFYQPNQFQFNEDSQITSAREDEEPESDCKNRLYSEFSKVVILKQLFHDPDKVHAEDCPVKVGLRNSASIESDLLMLYPTLLVLYPSMTRPDSTIGLIFTFLQLMNFTRNGSAEA